MKQEGRDSPGKAHGFVFIENVTISPQKFAGPSAILGAKLIVVCRNSTGNEILTAFVN